MEGLIELHRVANESGGELEYLLESIELFQAKFNTSWNEAIALNVIPLNKAQYDLYKALYSHYKEQYQPAPTPTLSIVKY